MCVCMCAGNKGGKGKRKAEGEYLQPMGRCNACGFENRNYQVMSNHIFNDHFFSVCPECHYDLEMLTFRNLYKHFRNNHTALAGKLSEKYALYNLVSYEDDADKVMECKKCSYMHSSIYYMDIHVMQRHIKKQCPECEALMNRTYHLKHHFYREHPENADKLWNRYKPSNYYDRPSDEFDNLEVNDESNVSKEKVEESNVSQSLKETLKCLKCGLMTHYRYSLFRHVLKVHFQNECPFCAKSSHSFTNLLNHIKEMHKTEETADTYRMNNWILTVENSTRIRQRTKKHQRMIEKNSKGPLKSFIFRCKHCDYQTKDSLLFGINRHIMKQHMKNKCPECHHPVINFVDLRMHFQTVHVEQAPELMDRYASKKSYTKEHTSSKSSSEKTQIPIKEDNSSAANTSGLLVSFDDVKEEKQSHPEPRILQENDDDAVSGLRKRAGRPWSGKFYYTCNRCSFKSITPNVMKNHGLNKHLNKCCPSCQVSIKGFSHLRSHFRKAHPNESKQLLKLYRSDNLYTQTLVNSPKVKKPITVKITLKDPSDNKLVENRMPAGKCNNCDYQYRCAYGLSRHILHEHFQDSCPECQKKLGSNITFYVLHRHFADSHPDSVTDLEDKYSVHTLASYSDDPGYVLQCSKCSHKHRSVYWMNKHVVMNHMKSQCPVCHKKMALMTSLKQHFAEAHADDADNLWNTYKPSQWYNITDEVEERLSTQAEAKETLDSSAIIVDSVDPKLDEQSPVPKNMIKMYTCRFCAFQSKILYHVRNHVKDEHFQKNCPECKVKVSDFRSMQKHFKKEHTSQADMLINKYKLINFIDINVIPKDKLKNEKSINHDSTENQYQYKLICNRCSFEPVTSQVTMNSHIMKVHLKNQCPECHESVKNFNHLRWHFKVEHFKDNKRLQVKYRSKSFYSEVLTSVNDIPQVSEEQDECLVSQDNKATACNVEHEPKRKMRRFMTSESYLSCNKCAFKILSPFLMNVHVMSKHLKNRCPICHDPVKNFLVMRRHFREKHCAESRQLLKQYHSQNFYSVKTRLATSLKHNDMSNTQDSDEDDFEISEIESSEGGSTDAVYTLCCGTCSLKFLTKQSLMYHLWREHWNKHCPACDQQISTMKTLKHHIMLIHSDIMSLMTNERMKLHAIIQEVSKNDGKKSPGTNSQDAPSTEVSNEPHHDTPDTLHCKQCSFKSIYLSMMARHIMKIHLQNKCPQCSFQVKAFKDLNKHAKNVHVTTMLASHYFEGNPYVVQCNYCKFTAKNKKKCASHIFEKHLKGKCPECKEDIETYKELRFHFKEVHENKSDMLLVKYSIDDFFLVKALSKDSQSHKTEFDAHQPYLIKELRVVLKRLTEQEIEQMCPGLNAAQVPEADHLSDVSCTTEEAE